MRLVLAHKPLLFPPPSDLPSLRRLFPRSRKHLFGRRIMKGLESESSFLCRLFRCLVSESGRQVVRLFLAPYLSDEGVSVSSQYPYRLDEFK
jgi:hypothetical protein